MTTKVRQIDDVSVVTVDGRVVLGDGDADLLARVRELLDHGHRRIALDLSGVPYMDSCGVGRLVECYTQVRERNGELKLLKSSTRVRDVLRITGLDRIFEPFVDEGCAASC